MEPSTIRILVVDDHEQWRHLFCSMLGKKPQFRVIGEASDGLEAVQKVAGLRPDLILLDIGLPTLNGIEAARRIRDVSPVSRILFVSENRSAEIAEEALNTGAGGYLIKSDVSRELLLAVNAVLEGKRFVSESIAGHITFTQTRHEVGFYVDDVEFLGDVTRFIGNTLRAGNSAIVVATEAHRESLVVELRAQGLDMDSAIQEGRYIPLDAAATLSMFMVDDMPDPARFLELLGDLIVEATEAAKREDPRVAVFGECVHLLRSQGNSAAALQMEKLGNKLTQIHAVNIFCAYSLASDEPAMDAQIYRQICEEHTAVHSRQ